MKHLEDHICNVFWYTKGVFLGLGTWIKKYVDFRKEKGICSIQQVSQSEC